MLRTFVNGKIHQLKVTGLQPKYSGSCLICPELLAAAGIEPFEKVEIYSLTSTARIATYVFPGAVEGEFTLNGGAALHFRLGDRVALVAEHGNRQPQLVCQRPLAQGRAAAVLGFRRLHQRDRNLVIRSHACSLNVPAAPDHSGR